MKKITYIFYSELKDILHDTGILIFILFVPLAYPLLYSWVYTNEVVREVPAVVVDESGSIRSREFIRSIDASPDVRIVARCRSTEEAKGWVNPGAMDGPQSGEGYIRLNMACPRTLLMEALRRVAENVH